jgi:hypothetical protein
MDQTTPPLAALPYRQSCLSTTCCSITIYHSYNSASPCAGNMTWNVTLRALHTTPRSSAAALQRRNLGFLSCIGRATCDCAATGRWRRLEPPTGSSKGSYAARHSRLFLRVTRDATCNVCKPTTVLEITLDEQMFPRDRTFVVVDRFTVAVPLSLVELFPSPRI